MNPSFNNALGQNWNSSSNHGTPGKINSAYISAVKNEKSDLILT